MVTGLAAEVPVLEAHGLGVRVDGHWLFRGLEFSVRAGEHVAVTGPSGCGKSTLLKCLLGLAVPGEGCVVVKGTRLDGRSVWAARRRLAYVAQEPALGPGTVREAVGRAFCYRANRGAEAAPGRLEALLDAFQLPQALLEKPVSLLSGGERQRVALVAALLLEREVLLLDEPSAALDAANRRLVAAYCRGAARLTVVSVSHDDEWLAGCDRVADMAGLQADPAGEAA